MTPPSRSAMLRSIPKSAVHKVALWLAGFLVPTLLLTTGLLLSNEFDRSDRLRHAVDQSYQRRAQLQAVLSLHQDIETGQRGYIVTGASEFLEPHARARAAIQRELVTLEYLLSDDAQLRGELVMLKAASARKLRFADQAIALEKSGRRREAAELVAQGVGRRTMDIVRRSIARIDALERDRLRVHLLQSEAATDGAHRLSIILQVSLALLLLVMLVIVTRTLIARRDALRRVEDLGARQAAILDNARDGIIILNPSGSIESLNPAAAQMYGYAGEDLLSRDIGMLFDVAPERGKVETFLKRMQRRRTNDSSFVQEFWGRRADGTTFPTDVAVSPVPLPDGMRYVAIVRDITDRKRVDQMKSEFVSTVSHELRTPLTSIAGSLGLLAAGAAGVLPGRAGKLIGIAKNNSDRLVRLVNDILDIEKIGSESMMFRIEPVALAPLLKDAIEANAGFATEQGVTLTLRDCPDAASVMADADRLTQVVTNLLSNAAKFSPAGSAVCVSAEAIDHGYRISVADRGPGIVEAFKPRVFDKFAQADSSDARRKGGTGLGLSITREIVLKLGGRIAFEDRDGGGTTFNVDLPDVAEPAQPITDRDIREGENLPHILHVEDDPDMLRVVAECFAPFARLSPAITLAAARAALAKGKFDLMILDIALPDGSGLELLAEDRRDSELPKPPAIIFSAQEANADAAGKVELVLVKSRASCERLVEAVLATLAKVKLREAAQ